jgi:hypothetical protein
MGSRSRREARLQAGVRRATNRRNPRLSRMNSRMEGAMATWKTVAELAAERSIDLATAQTLVDATNCPKVFGLHGTVYLI